MRKTALFIINLIIACTVFGQEMVTGLQVNPALLSSKLKIHKNTSKQYPTVTVLLPFLDDFSYYRIYPNDTLWLNNYAYINSDYPKNPPTVGVATLDAINDSGGHYSNASSIPFIADFLTSQLIRTDSLFTIPKKAITIADSLYFSFYYQPQGIGDYPNFGDSLILEFFSPKSQEWHHIWSTQGMSLDSFYNKYNTYFRRILIPIKDTLFISNAFQFRFKNYASLANITIPSWSGNVDQWHIDYVYLNVNRNVNDTSINDVSFVEHKKTLLKNYYSMPWKQFLSNPTGEMKDTLAIKYRNLSNVIKNVDEEIKIFDLSGSSPGYSPLKITNGSMPPFSDTTFFKLINYQYNSTIPASGNVGFEVIATINSGNNINFVNDTLKFYQKFFNYFSYDDGSPEAGYGLTPAGSRLAYKFMLNIPDTLKSVQFFFNQTLNSANKQFFYLTVWNDNNGVPGTVIYEKGGHRPEFKGLNEFYNYELSIPVYVSGTFYVGWRQTTDDNLNVGFDLNTNHSNKIFYNVDGSWKPSQKKGALMIRPVLGSESKPYVGINETLITTTFNFFPNPVTSGFINIASNDETITTQDYTIEIINPLGKKVMTSAYVSTLNVQHLSNGLYFIRLTNTKNQTVIATHKLLVQN